MILLKSSCSRPKMRKKKEVSPKHLSSFSRNLASQYLEEEENLKEKDSHLVEKSKSIKSKLTDSKTIKLI